MSIEPSKMISHDTIRSHLKRKVRRILLLCGCGLVLFVLGPLAMETGKGFVWFPFVGWAMFMAGIITVQWFTKCPKCETRLGQEMSWKIGARFWGKAPNFCPYCGVSLDEPLP